MVVCGNNLCHSNLFKKWYHYGNLVMTGITMGIMTYLIAPLLLFDHGCVSYPTKLMVVEGDNSTIYGEPTPLQLWLCIHLSVELHPLIEGDWVGTPRAGISLS